MMDNPKNSLTNTQSPTPPACYHCGLPCEQTDITLGDKHFCCRGCQTVYEILEENNLCQYYQLNENPGQSPREFNAATRFGYLDDETVKKQLIDFSDGKTARVTFNIPTMHCSSCIWLLEQLYKLNAAITESKVNFLRKELSIIFNEQKVSLREIVELLSAIGYEPQIRLDDLQKKASTATNKSLYIKIGVAGFAFGNIMLLSFPEYFSVKETLDFQFRQFFGILNILLALPVLFYSASEYLVSAYKGLRHKTINMDVPISLGIITLFSRSLYEIVTGSGAGYMDSFVGLIFLLLLGKLFQKKTYETLSFERDYKSFFPIAVTRKNGHEEISIPLSKLNVGDRIIIRHQELIPADSILISGQGFIDYSFVTGESHPQERYSGDLIYAGGRQTGSTIEVEVVKEVSQSYLTQLWNADAFGEAKESRITTLANSISKYFTIAMIAIASLGFLYWLPTDLSLALNAFTAVLIIACPCALALSTPFTLGNVLRIFGKNQFYLKNATVIEALAQTKAIVFDKTGTLTHAGDAQVEFVPLNGNGALTPYHRQLIKSVVSHSTHPLSVAINQSLNGTPALPTRNFQEIAGKGLEARIDNQTLKIGSHEFIRLTPSPEKENASEVFVAINDQVLGYFRLTNRYRPGLRKVIDWLRHRYAIALLSGDNDSEMPKLKHIFPEDAEILFNQSPFDKLTYIKRLQSTGKKVLMIGDGLNDAGALQQSDVGISISENLNNFSPACDGILHGNQFTKLPEFLRFSRLSMDVIRFNFGVSFLYNSIGLSFAVQGTLSPLISAILMPISSVTVILLATGLTNLVAYRLGFLRKAPPEHPNSISTPEERNGSGWKASKTVSQPIEEVQP